MKKLIIACILAVASLTACGGGEPEVVAQETKLQITAVQPVELVPNSLFTQYTTETPYYKNPVGWACKNYPRINRACAFDVGHLKLLSTQMGSTVTARLALPIYPTWTSTFTAPVAGVYTYRIRVQKDPVNSNTNEKANQAMVFKDVFEEISVIPHMDLTPSVEKEITFERYLTAGQHNITYALATRNSYQTTGYMYSVKEFSVTAK